MGYERAINVAYDPVSEVLLDAGEIFRGAKNAFEIRRQYHARARLTFAAASANNRLAFHPVSMTDYFLSTSPIQKFVS